LPDVPTISEHPGLAGFELANWFGFVAPGQTPVPVIVALHSAISDALERPKIQERLSAIGAYTEPMPPEAFGAFIRSEIQKFGLIIKQSGIVAER
jgi:tripartite-type tricarboxylate transporter receptor subunit TctC